MLQLQVAETKVSFTLSVVRKIAKFEEKRSIFSILDFVRKVFLVHVKQKSCQSQKEAQWEQQVNMQVKQLAYFSKLKRQSFIS